MLTHRLEELVGEGREDAAKRLAKEVVANDTITSVEFTSDREVKLIGSRHIAVFSLTENGELESTGEYTMCPEESVFSFKRGLPDPHEEAVEMALNERRSESDDESSDSPETTEGHEEREDSPEGSSIRSESGDESEATEPSTDPQHANSVDGGWMDRIRRILSSVY